MTDTKYTTWLMGNWKPKKMDIDPTEEVSEVARFLRGEVDLGLPPEQCHALRTMFAMQERWRSTVESELRKLVAHLQKQSAPCVDALRTAAPQDPVQQAQLWRAQGKYEAYTEDANHVMHVIESGWVPE